MEKQFITLKVEELKALIHQSFCLGSQTTREMLALSLDNIGYNSVASSIRMIWNTNWGEDPGQIPPEALKSLMEKGIVFHVTSDPVQQ